MEHFLHKVISRHYIRKSTLGQIQDFTLMDWSLITGRGGGGYKTGGGACEVLPQRKGGGGVLAMPKGEVTKSCRVVFTW